MILRSGNGKFTQVFIFLFTVKRFLQIIFFWIGCTGFFSLQGQVYIAPGGNDHAPGTAEQPKATLNAALRYVRELRRLNDPSVENGYHIYIKGGRYNLAEPVFIRPEDSGTEQSPLWIEAVAGEKPEFSGGITITGWKPLSPAVTGLPAISKNKVWVADVPALNGFRQLWVNGVKAIRAKSPNGNKMDRILNWDKKNETAIIPVPANIKPAAITGAEMFIHQWWEIAVLRIRKMEVKGDSAVLHFLQPESRIQSEHPWPAPWISKETGNSAFYLANAIEFLDEPGEWYWDARGNKLYYWPRAGEDMRRTEAVIPFLETLVKMEGTAEAPVKHIHFKNISFQHTGWNRPSLQGHVPHQAGMPMTDAYKLKPAGTKDKASLENQAWITRPAAAVAVSYAQHTSFESCSFRHLAATGLDYHKGVQHNLVKGNLLKDIGGTAILGGVFSDESFEIHLSYNPKDERVVCDSLTIINNFITDATNEDWGAVGIGLGYTRNSMVAHNEISNVSYSGISMGWGWSPAPNVMRNNTVTANYIHHYGKHNYDCAGIYTLSAQPGALISENVVDSIYKAPYAHLPTHWFYLYTDEGSAGITIKNNWTPTQKYLQNNNGPGNLWENNGPQVSNVVKSKAGLQAGFTHLTLYRSPDLNTLPVNRQHHELIELVMPKGRVLDTDSLRRVLIRSNLDPRQVYQWKNRYVVLGLVQDATVLLGRLKNAFPFADVRPYHDMYYQFDRSRCGDTVTASEWDHYILTANLVEDKKKQKQYLDDHATQFEKWPEVAKGFCNAQFQQLLCFRNGRQLMLVISVPKGKTLAELDPKTTENNPRVTEWNKRMAQYQQGIEGTKKGEVWVFLKKVDSP